MGPRSTVFGYARVRRLRIASRRGHLQSNGLRRLQHSQTQWRTIPSKNQRLQVNSKKFYKRTGAHSCPVRSPVPMSRSQSELGSKNPLGLLPFIPGTAPQARQFTMKRTSRSLRSSRAHCEFTLNFTGSSQCKCEILPNFTLPGSPQLQNPPLCPT